MSAITSKRSVTLFSLNNYLMGEVKFSIVTGYNLDGIVYYVVNMLWLCFLNESEMKGGFDAK